MKAGVSNGYLLKKTFEQPDEDFIFIDVQLPKVKGKLNLGLIQLEPKYPEQIKLTTDKMADLQTIRRDFGKEGDWIDELSETQRGLEGLFTEDDDPCESHFTKDSWGADNNFVPEPVKRVALENSLKPSSCSSSSS